MSLNPEKQPGAEKALLALLERDAEIWSAQATRGLLATANDADVKSARVHASGNRKDGGTASTDGLMYESWAERQKRTAKERTAKLTKIKADNDTRLRTILKQRGITIKLPEPGTYHGVTCSRCGGTLRYEIDAACVQCRKARGERYHQAMHAPGKRYSKTRPCTHCGKPFRLKHSSQRYCSPKCLKAVAVRREFAKKEQATSRAN